MNGGVLSAGVSALYSVFCYGFIFPPLITSSVSANPLVYFTLKDKKIVSQFLSDWKRLLLKG